MCSVMISNACSPQPTFLYKVKVSDCETLKEIPNVSVSLETQGDSKADLTDSIGIIIFQLNLAFLKKVGTIKATIAGYDSASRTLPIEEIKGYVDICLNKIKVPIPTPTSPSPTNIPPVPAPTAVPRPSATPIIQSDSKSITCALTAFGSYYPTIQIVNDKLDKDNDFKLNIHPLSLKKPDGTILNVYDGDELYSKLRTGEIDCVLTTLDVFALFGNFGVITAIVDESAGADQVWAKETITTLNELRGKTIAYEAGSTSEFMVYSLLDIAGLKVTDVTLSPAIGTTDAIKRFNEGQANVISAWEPDIVYDRKGGRKLTSTEDIRYIVDVIVFSHQAIKDKKNAIQAFHRAWFQALKIQFDDPARAAKSIAAWGENQWTRVGITKPQQDLDQLLEHVGQAGWGANIFVMDEIDRIHERLKHSQRIWSLSDKSLPKLDVYAAVDPSFILALRNDETLKQSKLPKNPTFSISAEFPLPKLPITISGSLIATLPCGDFSFLPDSSDLTPDSLKQLDTCVLPVLKQSRLYLRVTGSSAWPGPQGLYVENQIKQFARDRALTIKNYLAANSINPNRVISGEPLIPPPQRRNISNEEELKKDRFVKLEIVSGGR